MPYTVPTPADFIAIFPAFTSVPDAQIQAWIDRAARMHDASWTEGDYTFGVELLTAHYLALQGLGASADATAAATGTAGYQTIRSGQLTLQRFTPGTTNGDDGSMYSQTSYGRQWLALLRLNKPAIAAGSGQICLPPQYGWRGWDY